MGVMLASRAPSQISLRIAAIKTAIGCSHFYVI